MHYMCIHICNLSIFRYTNERFSMVLLKGIDHGLSPVVHVLRSEARHARSEATRFVAAN